MDTLIEVGGEPVHIAARLNGTGGKPVHIVDTLMFGSDENIVEVFYHASEAGLSLSYLF